MNVIKKTSHSHSLTKDYGYDFCSDEIVYTIDYPSDTVVFPRVEPVIATIRVFRSKNLQYYQHYTNNESIYTCEINVEGERYSGGFEYYFINGTMRINDQTKDLVKGFDRVLEKMPPGSTYKDIIYDYPTFKWLVPPENEIHPTL